MLTSGSGRMWLVGSVPPAMTATRDIWTKISPKLRKESAAEAGFSGLSGQVRPGDPRVDQSPQRPSSPLGILHAKPYRAADREPRASASPRVADHSPRLQRMPERRCKGEESWKNPGSGVHARPILQIGKQRSRERKALLTLTANKKQKWDQTDPVGSFWGTDAAPPQESPSSHGAPRELPSGGHQRPSPPSPTKAGIAGKRGP